MSLIDVLRGRPQPTEVARIVTEADSSVARDPAGARLTLQRLGQRPWDRAKDRTVIDHGFALRSHASWLLDDDISAAADIEVLAPSAVAADPLLPLTPILVSPRSVPINGAAGQLIERFGGCGRADCGHASHLEAALSIVASAVDVEGIRRWTAISTPTGDGSSLRLAAFRRSAELGGADAGRGLLDGADERLVAARARLAYDEGRYEAVVSILPPGHELAGRAALALVLRDPGVGGDIRRVATTYAEKDPCARALLAEADAAFGDAATAWLEAGRSRLAREAAILASPRSAHEFDDIDDEVAWFAYAAGQAPRPSSGSTTSNAAANAVIGDERAWLAAVGSGSGRPRLTTSRPALSDLETVLDRLATEPQISLSMLAGIEPPGDAVGLMPALATTRRRRTVQSQVSWLDWLELNASVPPLPRPVAPLRWLAGAADTAMPPLARVDALRPEERLPVLAAMVALGDPGTTVEASRLIEPDELSDLIPAAIPELAGLAFALASRRDLDAAVRRRAALLASACLANGSTRGAWSPAAADGATTKVAAAIADLHPDPHSITPVEGFHVERESLDRFPTRERRRATGPILCMVAGVDPPPDVPDGLSRLYDPRVRLSYLLLRAGRPDAARQAFEDGPRDDTALAAEIAMAVADRHLAGGRPDEALHELASVPEPSEYALLDGDLLHRVASAVIRNGQDDALDAAIRDADVLHESNEDVSEFASLAIELRLRRCRIRPGSAALDVSDLEDAYAIDPDHPQVPRRYAWALVTRASEVVERTPATAVRDVDRATDIFMGDADLIQIASNIASRAAFYLMQRRDIRAADAALVVALAINPNNRDAMMGRMTIRGRT